MSPRPSAHASTKTLGLAHPHQPSPQQSHHRLPPPCYPLQHHTAHLHSHLHQIICYGGLYSPPTTFPRTNLFLLPPAPCPVRAHPPSSPPGGDSPRGWGQAEAIRVSYFTRSKSRSCSGTPNSSAPSNTTPSWPRGCDPNALVYVICTGYLGHLDFYRGHT